MKEVSVVGTPRSRKAVEDVLLPKARRRRRAELSSYFSPHLEKIPNRYFFPKRGERTGTLFKDNAGAVARLLIESYDGDNNKVEKAAKLARRVLEMLEFELQNPRSDCLVDAAGSGALKQVRKLIQKGVEIDSHHSVLGYTALHAACDFGHLDIVKELLQAGADLYATRQWDNSTALHCAAENGHAKIVQFLVLEIGFDKLRKNKFGLIAFDAATINSHDRIMDILREPPATVQSIRMDPRHKISSRSARVEWRIPDDQGVDIIEYELSIVTVSGTEAKVFPQRTEEIVRILIDAKPFGPNPYRSKRRAELEKRLDKMYRAKGKHAPVIPPNPEYQDSAATLDCPNNRNGNNNNDEKSNSKHSQSESDEEEEEEEVESKGDDAEEDVIAWASYLFDETLFPATQYALTIRSRSISGWSKASDMFTFRTLTDVPDAPGTIDLAESGASCSTIDLEWDAPLSNNGNPVLFYELHVQQIDTSKDSHDEEWNVVSSDIIGSVSQLKNEASGNVCVVTEINPVIFTVQGLQSESSFRFRVRAKNADGYGAFSTESHVLRTRPATSVLELSAKSMVIDWSESLDASMQANEIERWEVQRSVPPTAITKVGRRRKDWIINESNATSCPEYDWRDAVWQTISDTIPGEERTMKVTKLLPSTMYYFRVRPLYLDKSLPTSSWDNCAVSLGIVTPKDVPEEPSQPQVKDADQYDEAFATISHCSIQVSWTLPRENGSRVDAFGIRFTKAATLNAWQLAQPQEIVREMVDNKDVAEFSHVVMGLDAGCAYKFAVRARNEIGWGPYSTTTKITRTRPSAPPEAPRLVARTDATIHLEWEQGGAAAVQAMAAQQLCFQVQMKAVPKEYDRNLDGTFCKEWLCINDDGLTSTNEVVVLGLQPVTLYLFRVRARVGANGEWTNFSEPGGPFKTARRF